MEFLSAIGILALIALAFFLFALKDQKDRQETERLRQLLAGDIMKVTEFERYWKAHSDLSYENALRKFFSEPGRMQKAEQDKRERDELHHKIEERQKKDNTIKRVFSYKYEDFLYSLYSPFATYSSSREEWDLPYNSLLHESYIIHRLKDAGYNNASDLYYEFINKGLIDLDRKTRKCRLGAVLDLYANVVSDEDNNLDKWIKTNGQAMTKEELMDDILSYEESLVD